MPAAREQAEARPSCGLPFPSGTVRPTEPGLVHVRPDAQPRGDAERLAFVEGCLRLGEEVISHQ